MRPNIWFVGLEKQTVRTRHTRTSLNTHGVIHVSSSICYQYLTFLSLLSAIIFFKTQIGHYASQFWHWLRWWHVLHASEGLVVCWHTRTHTDTQISFCIAVCSELRWPGRKKGAGPEMSHSRSCWFSTTLQWLVETVSLQAWVPHVHISHRAHVSTALCVVWRGESHQRI